MLMQGFNSDLESLKRDISQAFELWETNSNNFIIDDTKLYSINLELMKYIKINEGNSPNQPNKTNLMPTQEMNRVNLNKDYKKENVQGLEKYKNFQKYLEYTKSPIKLKKPQTLVENLNQRDLMQSSRQNLGI